MTEEYTEAPFYVHAVFNRFCHTDWECDWCEFEPEENPEEDGGVCPDNLWWYVMQRQKVLQNFREKYSCTQKVEAKTK